MKNVALSLLFFLFCASLTAQITLPVPRNIQPAYQKGTRSTTGIPGKMYWQNKADYDIRIAFDPATRKITGTETVTYFNQSPDTLNQLLFKLYPNLYQEGAIRMVSLDTGDVDAGIKINQIMVGETVSDEKNRYIDGTNMTLGIPTLLPGQNIRCRVSFEYTLNAGSHFRTGMIEEGAYFIAYFFPRIAVYDDLDGWNRHPYLGTQEFYNDLSNFRLAVTVPENYVVWATGDLLNCGEVLAPKYGERIAAAERNDAIIDIIDTTDLKTGHITSSNVANTFQFRAADVPDVALAISNHYVWRSGSVVVDSVTMRRTRVDAVFNPQHQNYYEVADFARQTVGAMSFRFPRWPFPYAHETVFDGLDQMEYPMMVNDNPIEDRAEAIELTDHEIFHTMFPFYMGTNETKYGWMDEGWATLGEWLISPMIDTAIVDEYGVAPYEKSAGTEDDLPIITLTTQENGMSMFTNSYPKPAMGYLFAWDMLGDAAFYKGLHFYIEQWHGKHPMPLDFFNCMNTGSGTNLNWFWKRWFYDDGIPDLAITRVVEKKNKKTITITSIGAKPVPVDLTIVFTDNSSQQIHRSAAVWEKGNTAVEVTFSSGKTIQSITLGSTYVPDADHANNRWPASK